MGGWCIGVFYTDFFISFQYIYIAQLESDFCRFSNVALQFSCLGHFAYCVIPLFLRGSHPLPDLLPGEHTGLPFHMTGNTSLSFGPSIQHSLAYTHSWQIEVQWFGHVLTDHTCSFMCTSHINMMAHSLSLFMSWRALWKTLVCSYDISHSRIQPGINHILSSHQCV